MKKIILVIFLLVCLVAVGCTSSDNNLSDGVCLSNGDCPLGQYCSEGRCVKKGSDDGTSGGESDLPDSAVISDDEDSRSVSDNDVTENSDTDGETSDHDHGDTVDDADAGNPVPDDADSDDSDNEPHNVHDTELPPDADVEFCEDTCVPMEPECLPEMASEYESGLCNGLDDDCDGKIDEGCFCTAGQTQPCFMGPRNFRNIGTCKDGVQTCKVVMRAGRADSYGTWGECVGGISPSADICDNADNACNGCVDRGLCCAPPIDCAYDLTADGPFLPFKYKIIDGKQIYRKFDDADTATWEWTLTKGPCDEILGNVNSFVKGGKTLAEVGDIDTDNGVADTVVSGVGLSQFKVKFRLSGNYKLHLKVTRENGEVYECEWVIRVVSDGLRIELCWDTNTKVDADLHLGKNGVTTDWTGSTACYYGDCKGNPEGTIEDHSSPNWSVSGWGYEKTDNYNKQGHLVKLPNPRLDLDNIKDGPVPENINLDNPEDGDVFRVGVKYFSGSCTTHPVINVYCGGTLKATYGVEPQVSGFTTSPQFWKVVEIKWVGDYASDACELTPKWSSSGYVVNTSVPSYSNW